MVIAEENHTSAEVLGQAGAPYLTRLAGTFATLTRMDAGYPVACPSLAAYLLMTSGSTHEVCDDAGPQAHPIDGPSIFSQVEEAGGQWRGYAESMPAPCTREDAAGGRYLVRHASVPYYTALARRCRTWDLPLGTPTAGALHDDVATGRLPVYAFVPRTRATTCTVPPAAAISSPRATRGCTLGSRRFWPAPTTAAVG
jgi:hypothetical protein